MLRPRAGNVSLHFMASIMSSTQDSVLVKTDTILGHLGSVV